MKIEGNAKLLRIFIGETDKINHIPVYEKIVNEARIQNLAGATVYKGIMGFGGNSRVIHSAKILRLSEDLPLVIEIVDTDSKIQNFIPTIDQIFEEAKCGGLITTERAEIIKYSFNEEKQ